MRTRLQAALLRQVLTQFEATTASIKGIESKMSKARAMVQHIVPMACCSDGQVNHYMEAVQARAAWYSGVQTSAMQKTRRLNVAT